MEDVTDVVFREIISKLAKPDVFFTEFTSIDALFSKGRETAEKRLRYNENQRPVVAQIWGTDPEKFRAAAEFIAQLGFDGIDINMGCPDKSVLKRGAGAALINNNELTEKIIKSVKLGAPNLPLSIKTRLAPDQLLTNSWFSFLLSMEIDALTIHARTAKELSKFNANWQEIGNAVKLKNKLNPEIILIGNGDVESYCEILEKHKTYGVDGVMVGRGIFKNPWLFEKGTSIKEHTKKEYIELLNTHTKLFSETWGKDKNFETMKKFFKIYCSGFSGSAILRARLMECESFSDIVLICKQILKKSI